MTTPESASSWPAPALAPLPLGAIRPLGWLRDQLRVQADGLSGHLDEFWPSVADSKWIGGTGEGWERGPYWLDGIVPLAFLLDDAALKAKAQHWMDYLMDHQHPDGWLGVIEDGHAGEGQHVLDPWPIFVLLKAMTQWQEATGDARIIPAMQRVLRRIDSLLDEKPLESWAAMRWFELSVSLQWLYARTGEAWLLGLSRKAQEQGYDWPAHFADFRYTGKQAPWTLENHVVNNAMALKEPALRLPPDPNGGGLAQHWMATLDRYHGQAAGVFSGDESLAGLNPSQGTETCAVVEYLYSLEVLLSTFGDAALGDRLERIAFNALPAPFKSDMWARQYDQQANQVVCKRAPDGERIYTNNGPEANLFSLEGHFGCCTANMHQGWPKFVSHLWMATEDGGMAAIAYGPCEVQTTIAGRQVTITEETDYPFRALICFTVKAASPVAFPLRLRVPAWAEGATVEVSEKPPVAVAPGTFHVMDRTWNDGDTVTLHLPMTVRTERGFQDSVRLLRGPLVFSLQIGEEFRQVGGEAPHADWEVYPTTPWNYGLALVEGEITVREAPIGPVPFAPDAAPVTLTAPARRVGIWEMHRNCAAPPPDGMVATVESLETVAMIPYGSGHLRVTDFPEAMGKR